MHLTLRSPPRILSSISLKMVLEMTKLLRASRMWLSPSSRLWILFSPFPMQLCGRIVLASKFLPPILPRMLEPGSYAHEVQNTDQHVGIDPSFPESSRDMLPSLPGIDVTAPSTSPTTAPMLLSTATKTQPDVCVRSSLPAVSSLILAASDHFLLPETVLNPEEDIPLFLCIFSKTSSLCSKPIH